MVMTNPRSQWLTLLKVCFLLPSLCDVNPGCTGSCSYMFRGDPCFFHVELHGIRISMEGKQYGGVFFQTSK